MDNEHDAVRHFIGSCLIAKRLDEDAAKSLGDAHERDTDDVGASAQDLFNNRRGREGSYRVQGDDIAGCAEQALRDLRSGQLMTRPFRPGGGGADWQRSYGTAPRTRP